MSPQRERVPVDLRMRHQGKWVRFWRSVGLAHRQPDALRLTTDIEGLQGWVDRHKPSRAAKLDQPPPAKEDGTSPKAWHVVCEEHLSKARDMAAIPSVPSGYEYLHIAERESVHGMNQEERLIRAQSLREEVESKLKGSWRGRAISKLLGEDKAADVPAASLAEAMWHRNTNNRNMYRKLDEVRWQLAWLGLFIGALVLIAFVVALRRPELPTNDMGLLPYGVYLGLLGGFVSSALSAKGTDRKASVPEIGAEFYARIARGLLGAAASVPVYIAGVEGLVAIGTDHSKPWGLLLLCFISGFSERWFRRTVAAVAGEGDDRQARSDKDRK
jgi:hypothetical protein